MFVLAFGGLLIATGMVRLARFSWLMHWFSDPGRLKPDVLVMDQVKQAIRRARILARWQPNCYPQALTAKWLMSNFHQPCEVYLGTLKDEHGFKAHAWTKCGDRFITGEPGAHLYTVVAKFPLSI